MKRNKRAPHSQETSPPCGHEGDINHDFPATFGPDWVVQNQVKLNPVRVNMSIYTSAFCSWPAPEQAKNQATINPGDLYVQASFLMKNERVYHHFMVGLIIGSVNSQTGMKGLFPGLVAPRGRSKSTSDWRTDYESALLSCSRNEIDQLCF